MNGPGSPSARLAFIMDELGKRFPDVSTLVAAPSELGYLAAIDKEREDRDDLQRTFDRMWDADMRAIKLWQAANPGNDHVWPDRSKLTLWLLDQITAFRAALATIAHNDGIPDGYLGEPTCGHPGIASDALKKGPQ